MNEIDISIVIVSYNVAEYMIRCLESIKEETQRCHEIIIVDNGSSDRSVQFVRERFPQVAVIENRENRGFAAANNQGFHRAKGKYVFMLNPDTLIQNGAVDKLADFLDSHPEISIAGPKNLNPDGSLQTNCHHFPSLATALWECLQLKRYFPQNRLFGQEHMTYWKYDDIREVDWITGSSLLIRREVLEKLGGLDEWFFMYSEECDLCYRAKQAGWPTVFFPEATIIHFGGQSALSQQKYEIQDRMILKHLFQSRFYFFRKHYGSRRELWLKIIYVIYYGVSFGKNKIIFWKQDRLMRMATSRTIIRQTLAGGTRRTK